MRKAHARTQGQFGQKLKEPLVTAIGILMREKTFELLQLFHQLRSCGKLNQGFSLSEFSGLFRWERGLRREAPCVGSVLLVGGGRGSSYNRALLHIYGAKGAGDAILCTDGKTIGLHRWGQCPFVAEP